ncbi:MAG: hypothetical protein FJY92_06575, partial [Candidatus Hydrogenedentes bacterium]|nr:hypothetical protein [Candidatus Hydrogenedentota bacterium]
MYLAICVAALLAGPQPFAVEGHGIGRAIVVDGGRVRTESIRSGAAGREVRVRGPEFAITYGGGAAAT